MMDDIAELEEFNKLRDRINKEIIVDFKLTMVSKGYIAKVEWFNIVKERETGVGSQCDPEHQTTLNKLKAVVNELRDEIVAEVWKEHLNRRRRKNAP